MVACLFEQRPVIFSITGKILVGVDTSRYTISAGCWCCKLMMPGLNCPVTSLEPHCHASNSINHEKLYSDHYPDCVQLLKPTHRALSYISEV